MPPNTERDPNPSEKDPSAKSADTESRGKKRKDKSPEEEARRTQALNSLNEIIDLIAPLDPDLQVSKLRSLLAVAQDNLKREIEAMLRLKEAEVQEKGRPQGQHEHKEAQDQSKARQQGNSEQESDQHKEAKEEYVKQNMGLLEDMLGVKESVGEKIDFLEKHKGEFPDPETQTEINKRIQQLRDQGEGRPSPQPPEGGGGGTEPPPDTTEGGEGGEQDPEILELAEIERKYMEAHRKHGEYYVKDIAYRTNTDLGDDKGRNEEEYWQKEINRLLELKKTKIKSIEKRRDELKEAAERIDEDSDEYKEYKKLLSDLKEGNIHKNEAREIRDSNLNITQLESRLNGVQGPNRKDRTSLRESIKINDFKITQLENELMRGNQDPTIERRIDSLRIEDENLKARIGVQNAIYQRIAELKLEGDEARGIPSDRRYSEFKKLEEKKKAYNKLANQINQYREGEIESRSKDFRGERNFLTAHKLYEENKGIDSKEAKKYHDLIDSYFEEARSRGYLRVFTETFDKILEDARKRSRQARSSELIIDPSEYPKIFAAINQFLLNPQTIMEEQLKEEVRLGKRAGEIDAAGNIKLTQEDDLSKFEGLTRVWLERAKKYFERHQSGEEIKPEESFRYEYTAQQEEGRYWATTWSGYYDITARSLEQFEAAVTSFSTYLTSGAIERDPQKLLQQLQYFEQDYSSKADANLHTKAERDQAAAFRHQLRAYVGFWSADYFASLANTQAYKEIMANTLNGLEGMSVMSATMKAHGGLVGLAIRLMDRDKRFLNLTRYHGENGNFALDSTFRDEQGPVVTKSGDLEYEVRVKTEQLLTEELAIYDLRRTIAGIDNPTLEESADQRNANLNNLVHFQTTDKFMGHFKIDTRAYNIRQALREGGKISREDADYYKDKINQAKAAVGFARVAHSALGERALKAAPSYIIEIRKKAENGNYLDQNDLEINSEGKLLYNGNPISRKAFIEEIERKQRVGQQIPEGLLEIYNREKTDLAFLRAVAQKQASAQKLSSKEQERYWKLKDKVPKSKEAKRQFWRKLFSVAKGKGSLYDDALVEGLGFKMERTDYVSKELAIKYMQFAENLARIMATMENKKRKDRGEELLTAYDIAKKAKAFRWQARRQIDLHGLQAKILDERGEEVFFKGQAAKVIDVINGFEVHEAQFLKEGKGTIDLESAVSVTTLVKDIAKERGLTKAQVDQQIESLKQEAKQKLEQLKREQGYIAVDFDGASSHAISQWNDQTYLALQHEIRSQILQPATLEAALRIRQGKSKPEEEDIVASLLLQIDPTLERIRHVEIEADNIALIHAHVEQSFQGHWRIIRELDRLFIDVAGEQPDKRTYYGIPNERFAIKELIWNANKVAREPERFARRAWALIPESPVHWSSLADTMGQDLSGMMGIFERSSWFNKEINKEVTDSNVTAAWYENIIKAYDVYVMFAKSGKVSTNPNEIVTSLLIKPFNDLDASEKINDFVKAMMNPANEISMYQGMRPLLGRLEALLKGVEAMDNTRASKGALWLEYADIFFDEDGKRAKVLYYDEHSGEVDKSDSKKQIEVMEDGEKRIVRHYISNPNVMKDTGSGAHSAYTFYREFIRYANEFGVDDYKAQAWAIWMMGKKGSKRKKSDAEFKDFWDWFGSKAIRTYPE